MTPMENDVVLTFAVEVPFLCICLLVVAQTIYLDLARRSKAGLFSIDTLQSSKAWLYLLYIVAILVTFIRLWLRNLEGGSPVPAELVTIIYNWATTLMIAVSSIMPARLALSISKVARVETKALKTVLALVGIWVSLLLVTIVALSVTEEWTIILTVWRAFFMLCAFLEMVTLSTVVICLKLNKLKTSRTLTFYVMTTMFMRTGIVLTIILKFSTESVDTFILKIAHMMLIIIGLSSYCYVTFKREQASDRRSSAVSSSHRTSGMSYSTQHSSAKSAQNSTTSEPTADSDIEVPGSSGIDDDETKSKYVVTES